MQAICDFVHHHIAFGYAEARATKTAWEVFNEKQGVCRDYAHLAITFCRCMNIPARYCTGYLGDIGTPPPHGVMDFAAWFEAYVGRTVANVRREEQYSAHRTGADGAWTRRNRRRHQQCLRSEHAHGLYGLDGRDHSEADKVSGAIRLLTVRHVTLYRYSKPVKLGEHRMMFRPRESYDLRLIQTTLNIVPRPTDLRWLHDVFDNSVAIAKFDDATRELRFESTVTLEHLETALPDYALEECAKTYPFRYPDEDFPDLVRGLLRHYPGDDVSRWVLRFLAPAASTDTMSLLEAMTLAIHDDFIYTRREEKGVQRPEETLVSAPAAAVISRC